MVVFSESLPGQVLLKKKIARNLRGSDYFYASKLHCITAAEKEKLLFSKEKRRKVDP